MSFSMKITHIEYEGTTDGWFLGTTQVFSHSLQTILRDVNYGRFPKYPQNTFSSSGDNSP
jgi:hypothetical protein